MALTPSQSYTQNTAYGRFGGYLEQQHFFGTFLLALMLHLGGVALYQILPKDMVELVPVRVLNIKIGNPVVSTPMPEVAQAIPDTVPDGKAPAPKAEAPKPKPAPMVAKPAPITKAVVKKAVVKPVVKPKPAPIVKPVAKGVGGKSISQVAKEMASVKAPIAKQYVREDAIPAARYTPPVTNVKGVEGGKGTGTGSAIGNSTSESAEIESRYTQTLSLWLNRYKVYPMEARKAGIGGTVMLRIRINRQGRIMRYYLERASGHEIIDRAISSMVNAANPVPAVPANYPDPRPYLEFLVPIHFKP